MGITGYARSGVIGIVVLALSWPAAARAAGDRPEWGRDARPQVVQTLVRGAYHVPPADDALARSLGITLVVREGMVYDISGEELKPVAVVCWDEPDSSNVPPEEAAARCKADSIRTGLPSYATLGAGLRISNGFGLHFFEYRNMADWVGVLLYPYTRGGSVFNLLAANVAAFWAGVAFHDRTWFGVIQAFDGDPEKHEPAWYVPTVREFRYWEDVCQMREATGVIAYAWSRGGEPLITRAWRSPKQRP